MEQELEWIEAQKIGVSVDLVAAAKTQLQFLAAVDRNRYLYEGPALHRAIYRFTMLFNFFFRFWVLLFNHFELQSSDFFFFPMLNIQVQCLLASIACQAFGKIVF